MGRRTPPGPLPVTLREVSFRYPGADQDVLDRIAVAIPPGQVVVLVGPNGAGKSTLAALILELYPPTRGSVHVGTGAVGHAVRGAVFQDFARYSLPLRDNVGFGDLSLLHNDDHLRAVLRRTGVALHADLDQWLGAEFGGRELSGASGHGWPSPGGWSGGGDWWSWTSPPPPSTP
ncbi:ATP-binding cassette domain-containing protein [Symbiobacterium thermophilum]|uniref:ABC transporter ATP-binding protein variant n=1 Tax=Symbiobacterium thermophilum (strain DSM 24528 / JCM 14929 / IAM 14863 / T) TaxID=292459 RepID=Q67MY4_SYMTH|nr:ATP-binding cassette domain-containing protein [Symbiobacterium thermophilum]BAD40959.1 ABC transporter ATP-binding protein variant [Symbiobacterium thermophilum IAM 14863]